MCSFNKEAAEHQKLQTELDKASETMKDFERKDVRFQEEIKQLKQKLQKLEDKQSKDRAKSEVVALARPFATCPTTASTLEGLQMLASKCFASCSSNLIRILKAELPRS